MPRRRVDRAALESLLATLDPIDDSLDEDEILGCDAAGIPEQPYLDR